MKREGLNDVAVAAFKHNLGILVSGASTVIPEAAISPVEALPSMQEIDKESRAALLAETVSLKLNGGLGTSMGLEKAKSLLPVKGDERFLDLIAKQVATMQERFGSSIAFMTMNSFSTSADTLEALAQHPTLGTGSGMELLQNKVPKVAASGFEPVAWPKQPDLEWCPPGHGDLYVALAGSGMLDQLLQKGYRFMFVSNADNLGATLDLKLLTYFADSKAPFMMEVADRTEADKKGGHLALEKGTGRLLLRELAQCSADDEAAFQDVGKYKYFNTNNLWVDLQALRTALDQGNGFLPLPVIKNIKSVDPRDQASLAVIQLETAMGAAISCFDGAKAVQVPRSRFSPVKTTSDLLALRSDAYVLTDDFLVQLARERHGVPPDVKLDNMYKFVEQLDALVQNGVPSLLGCSELRVLGPMQFGADVIVKGKVTFRNSSSIKKTIPPGTYEEATVDLLMLDTWPLYEEKMRNERLSNSAIAAFRHRFSTIASGCSPTTAASAVVPLESVAFIGDIAVEPKAELLKKTVVLKLNGGLGTRLGLSRATSSLTVSSNNTLLDLAAKQVTHMLEASCGHIALLVMNSSFTSADCLATLAQYPGLGAATDLELLQNSFPKVAAGNLEPASWPDRPAHEWFPAGTGDLFTALRGTGTLDRLVEAGFQYMFVSNVDNAGASLDLKLLTYFAESGIPFLMEVVERLESDKSSGHVAKEALQGKLIVREWAQLSEEQADFQDVGKYEYLNTNNIWLDLQVLKDTLGKCDGLLPLPVLQSKMPMDARDRASQEVMHLETTIGTAISCFEGAAVIRVPRSRFTPLKTSSDLFAFRSDAYVITSDFRLELAPERGGVPPNIQLDRWYKFADQLHVLAAPNRMPSLVDCTELRIDGPVEFANGVVIRGRVAIRNDGANRKVVAPGTYQDCDVDLTNVVSSRFDCCKVS